MKQPIKLISIILLLLITACTPDIQNVKITIVNGTEINTESLKSGETFTIPKLSKDGYELISITDNNNKNYQSNEKITVTEDMTFTYKWQKIINSEIFRAKEVNGEIEIDGYKGADDNVTIPTIIDGKNVTSIGDSAFADSDINSITIPASITTVADNAFEGWTEQQTIIIQKEVNMKNWAANWNAKTNAKIIYEDAANLTDYVIWWNGEGFSFTYKGNEENVVIPSRDIHGMKLTGIGPRAFAMKKNIKSVLIPDHITSIGDEAFYQCKISRILIPASVKAVGNQAFFNWGAPWQQKQRIDIAYGTDCTNWNQHWNLYCTATINEGYLEGSDYLVASAPDGFEITKYIGIESELTVPEYIASTKVTVIGDHCFSDENITKITIPSSIRLIKSSFEGNKRLTSIIIPGTVDNIGNKAFNNCENLQTVTIENGIQTIGEEAFANCINLETISIPNSVLEINSSAFANCSSLSTLTLGTGVQSIKNNAFFNCNNLLNIVIPRNVNYVGKDAFSAEDSPHKKTISISPEINMSNWDKNWISHTLVELKLENIQDWDIYWNNGSFITKKYSGNATTVDIPSAIQGCPVSKIGPNTFSDCLEITTINIPNSVTTIGREAFKNCIKLVSVNIPNTVTTIDNYAFSKCISLNNPDIPSSVTSIGNNAFSDCTGMQSITIPLTIAKLGTNMFSGCANLTTINLPNNLKQIPPFMFENCTSLSSINIPNRVTFIGNSAFNNCTNLSQIVLPPTLEEIGELAFRNCTKINSITIPKTVLKLGEKAFSLWTETQTIIINKNPNAEWNPLALEDTQAKIINK